MKNNQPVEAWERADSLNTYHFWLQMMREKGIRKGAFEPINDQERAIAALVKPVQQ